MKGSTIRHLCACALLATVVGMTAQPQSLHFLGVLPGYGAWWSDAFGVSLDGRVVGASMPRKGRGRAFVWTRESGMVELGTLGGMGSGAGAITPDGRMIFGAADAADGFPRAVSWTIERAIRPIDHIVATRSGVSAVSADGRVAVGTVVLPTSVRYAARWVEGGRREVLGSLRGDSTARDVSADGKVIVGGFDLSRWPLAFRWEDGVMTELDSGGQEAGSEGVSEDGSVVVGWYFSRELGQSRPCLWTREAGFVDIGGDRLWSGGGVAYDITPDARVIVGQMRGPTSAVRWVDGQGPEDLNVTFGHLLPPKSRMWRAMAVSDDGRYIVGVGYNGETGRAEAFVLDTGPGRALSPRP